MKLPANWPEYKQMVLDKIQFLCKTGVWPFDNHKFLAWLNNFDVKEEEYMMISFIDSLIIRSNSMMKVSYSRLFHGELRQYLISEGIIPEHTISEWKKKLKNRGLNNEIRFLGVKTNKDAQGESGPIIYRSLSDLVNTNFYTYDPGRECKALILIDDCVGSGNQFDSEFSSAFELNKMLEKIHIIYCPLIAYDRGLARLRELYPKLKIMPAEIIDSSYGLFDNSFEFFRNDGINTLENAKKYFEAMKKKYAPRMQHWFGYGDIGLPLVFEWGCPNLTPAVFWMNDSPNKLPWNQLFKRRS